jgi:hypothetical protein
LRVAVSFDEERERYVRAGVGSMGDRAIAWAKEHPDGEPGERCARAFRELEGAFVPDLEGTPESIADAFRELLREKELGVPANIDEAVANAKKREAQLTDPKARRSRMALHVLALTGTSNRALRKAGDSRRWQTLLRAGQYTLSEATFVLLDPKVKDALVKEGLYTSFMAGLGRQLWSFPLAIAFWIAAMHAWKSQTTVNVAIAGVLFFAWMGVRRWVARPAPT